MPMLFEHRPPDPDATLAAVRALYRADETEVVDFIVAVASGQCSEKELADWLSGHVSPLRD